MTQVQNIPQSIPFFGVAPGNTIYRCRRCRHIAKIHTFPHAPDDKIAPLKIQTPGREKYYRPHSYRCCPICNDVIELAQVQSPEPVENTLEPIVVTWNPETSTYIAVPPGTTSISASGQTPDEAVANLLNTTTIPPKPEPD